jgi:hypothetical protein
MRRGKEPKATARNLGSPIGGLTGRKGGKGSEEGLRDAMLGTWVPV